MFECCHYCKPPKRYPGCQDHCPDGIAAKAKHAEMKKAYDKARGRSNGTVYAQRQETIRRAIRSMGKKF